MHKEEAQMMSAKQAQQYFERLLKWRSLPKAQQDEVIRKLHVDRQDLVRELAGRLGRRAESIRAELEKDLEADGIVIRLLEAAADWDEE